MGRPSSTRRRSRSCSICGTLRSGCTVLTTGCATLPCPNGPSLRGEMYSILSGVNPSVPMPLAREQFIGLLPREFRAVNADGITMDQMRFDSPALHPYRRRPSGRGEPHPDLWQVHADPYRMNCIWLFDHEKREYIQADWNMAKQAVMPFSRETLALARRILWSRGETISGQSILRKANRIMTEPLTAAEKRAKRRQATPLVPPGTNYCRLAHTRARQAG